MSITCSRLIQLFNTAFSDSSVLLESGGTEPVYYPQKQDNPARIIFREDFLRSALHEISHWCIAGNERRKKIDYGYWYRPDGRNKSEQQEFMTVEAKPQALEKILSEALDIEFQPSLDNLTGEATDKQFFENNINIEYDRYLHSGLPVRARRLMNCFKEYNA